jgi:hypothetical protein
MFRRAGKWVWRPERVVLAEGCGRVADGGMAGVIVAGWLVLLPWWASVRVARRVFLGARRTRAQLQTPVGAEKILV